MPTVLQIGGLDIVIYVNDHRPAHVHVKSAECEAIFELNCPAGPATLRENYGFAKRRLSHSWRFLASIFRNFAMIGGRSIVTQEQYEEANRRAAELQTRVPRAVSARYDRHRRRIVVRLSSNLGIFFSPRDAQGLEHANPEQLTPIEITPSGYGLHFPKLDADLYVPSLLEGIFGSERWMLERAKPGNALKAGAGSDARRA